MNEDLKRKLQQGVVVVEFIKKDGTHRKMTCTLNQDFIPVEPVKEGADPNSPTKARKASIEAQPVYDIESNGWRSFRWDAVQDYTTIQLGDSNA